MTCAVVITQPASGAMAFPKVAYSMIPVVFVGVITALARAAMVFPTVA